ncbi:unnamed protein product [Pleuronectes platessa]|uniref:Uncharacterized protein n=1 Tax=Pleuronectes platessa TaxID=8262 RepID=A0A9N7UFX9_PLEPL|nr:unnamed protein product [Pleuronectes platessa]
MCHQHSPYTDTEAHYQDLQNPDPLDNDGLQFVEARWDFSERQATDEEITANLKPLIYLSPAPGDGGKGCTVNYRRRSPLITFAQTSGCSGVEGKTFEISGVTTVTARAAVEQQQQPMIGSVSLL